jgi:hypothetical protein
MNAQLNMKTQRRFFSPNVITLPVLVVVVLILGGTSIQAQTSTSTTASTAVVDSSVTIATKGTVSDPNGTITISGNVIVNSRRVIDTTLATPPVVLLDLDFSQLQGTSGSLKTLKTYVTGDNHATEIRPLQASDTIIVTCPYYDSTKDGLSSRSMLVTATLNFDTTTGKVTGGSITIGNNVVTSAMVGTTAM